MINLDKAKNHLYIIKYISVRYAGVYETPGQLIQVYDTLQESIDAEVTTPPSAIQRSGTDVRSNNPRLNIPGTPDSLT